MLESTKKSSKIFKFFPYLMWTHKKLKKDDNFVVTIPGQTEKYFLVLNSLRIHLCSSSSCFDKNKRGLNIDNSKVSVLLIDNKRWRKESFDILSQAMKYTWST